MLRPKIQIPSSPSRFALVTERIIQAAFCCVVLAAVCRFYLIDTFDPYKCAALQNKGNWLDPGEKRSSEHSFQNWQPPGCMLHEYKMKDIQDCFRKRRIVFAGDSTTRQVFWAVAQKMDRKRADQEISDITNMSVIKHTDIEFSSSGVTVQFLWDPFLNSTGLKKELRKFRVEPPSDDHGGDNGSAGLFLVGAPGLWFSRFGNGTDNHFFGFRKAVEGVIPYMDHLNLDDKEILGPPVPNAAQIEPPNFLLMAPVQVPKYELLSSSRALTITPERIDQMNDYLVQVSAHSNADVIWSYSLMTASGSGEYEESGLHVTENVAHRKADVVLNMRCNADSAVSKGYPFNRTCCSNYQKLAGAQWVVIFTALFALPTLWYARRRYVVGLNRYLARREHFNALLIFTSVVSFCIYADRTQVFEKSQKFYQMQDFSLACLVALAVGILTLRKNKVPGEAQWKLSEPNFLNRQQTDEWKGWMQAFILIYHYTHSSKILWIYEIVRILVASYLFMTGFGHTLNFLRNDDYSLRRVAFVLIRLNLLSCVLPYAMRTDYQFYYFSPLVSFWFIVIYLTLRVGRKRNSSVAFVVMKIKIAALLTTAFTTLPRLAESLALLLKYICFIHWDVIEWRFRTSLDMYIVYVGMLLAVIYQRTTTLRNIPKVPRQLVDVIIRPILTHPFICKICAVIGALVALPLFSTLSQAHTRKEDYNRLNPYLSCVPILAFITLRNCHNVLRSSHSAAFAWLGRCSLESYVLQYHIWLAGDSTGLLRTGLFNRGVDAIILTPIFLWISWRTADGTQTLTTWLVNDNGRDESGDGTGKKHFPAALPVSTPTSAEGTPSKERRFETDDEKAVWLVGRMGMTLGWRLVGIGIAMWIGNVTYR